MARRNKLSNTDAQLPMSFEDVIQSAQVLSKDEVESQSYDADKQNDYNPVDQTAGYMHRSIQIEQEWEGTIRRAREALLILDARYAYLEFINDLRKLIDQNVPQSAKYAELLQTVAIRGLGMGRQHLRIENPSKGGTRWRVTMDAGLVQSHLEKHIVGPNFLNPISINDDIWQGRTPLIGASDVSQHRSAVPVPARYFKRKVPFILNNAAGTLFSNQNGQARFDNVFNPKPDDSLLRWMLIDPSYQDELDGQDYERCIGSAMDVGQYKFDLEYLMKADKRSPDLIFRDGSLFPQDAYLDNYLIQNKRGEFTREAIHQLLDCLLMADALGIVYCGVSKNVQLKVYSALMDWFIAKYIDSNWNFGNYTLNDGQAMTLLLSSPDFVEGNLNKTVSTCLIRRSFTTRANLNEKTTNLADLAPYFRLYEMHNPQIDISRYRKLCEIGHIYMFFIGHAKSPQQQLPRYEFYAAESEVTASQKILSALQQCTLTVDNDHSFMAQEAVAYLLPSVTQQAHQLSKDVGSQIDTSTGQWIMSRFRTMIEASGGDTV